MTAGVAAVLYLTPRVLGISPGPSDCAPCDRGSVPVFDRWAIVEPRDGWSLASTIVVLGLGAAVAGDFVLDRETVARGAAVLGSAAWAIGATELIQAVVGRKRPVLYTSVAVTELNSGGSRRSFPSGHTAVAFALAASYWLNRGEHRPGIRRWAAVAAAVAVGVMRVTAGKHFPSDVLAGAAVGVSAALAVQVVKF